MKQYWLQLESRIDALGIRERAMAFAIIALLLITLIDSVALRPLLDRQKQLSQQIGQDQQQITAMQAEIQARARTVDRDPDAPMRARLQALKEQAVKLRARLMGSEQALVSPDRMASLLEDLLRQNGKLRLVSMKTLPPVRLDEDLPAPAAQQAQPKSSEARKSSVDAVYKHGVELVVQGSYADLVSYLDQLEKAPWRLFWAHARMNAENHPSASLTLTLFTLSLDKTWLNI